MSTEQPQSNRLYVGNIPWSTTVEELQGLFTDAENIEIPTVRFLLSFFCFYNFDSIALVGNEEKLFSRRRFIFSSSSRLNALSLRNLSSAKPPKIVLLKAPKTRREISRGAKETRGVKFSREVTPTVRKRAR
jgi:RNA recognition motif-containing protein